MTANRIVVGTIGMSTNASQQATHATDRRRSGKINRVLLWFLWVIAALAAGAVYAEYFGPPRNPDTAWNRIVFSLIVVPPVVFPIGYIFFLFFVGRIIQFRNRPIIRAIQLVEAGKVATAISELHSRIDVNPHSSVLWDALSIVFGNTGNWPEALKASEKALELCPKRRFSIERNGLALWKVGRSNEACVIYENLVQQYPDDFDLRCTYCEILAGDERLDEARQNLRRAEELKEIPVRPAFGLQIFFDRAAREVRLSQCRLSIESAIE